MICCVRYRMWDAKIRHRRYNYNTSEVIYVV